jgi:hypothetical protein
MNCRFARKQGQWQRTVRIRPDDLAIAFHKFPYPLEHATGTIDQELNPLHGVDTVRVELAGRAGSRQVFVKGEVTGDGPTAAVAFRVWGDGLPLNEKLVGALPPQHQRLARSFHPTGLADFEARIERPAGSKEFANRFLIRFHHATARYDVFPYPLEEVSGVLDIQPHRWEFNHFHGRHQGGEIQTQGRCDPGPDGDHLHVDISGDALALDAELRSALERATLDADLKRTWDLFSPSGHMKFQARVERVGDQPPDVGLIIKATGCTIRPEFFPYPLTDLRGTIRYAHRWVELEDCRARHGATVMAMDRGRIYLKEKGGVWAEIPHLQADPVIPDADLLHALPPGLRKVWEALELHDAVRIRTQLTVDSPPGTGTLPVIYWDGEMTVADARLRPGVPLEHVRGEFACRGRFDGHDLEGLVGNLRVQEAQLFRVPFREVQGKIEVKKDAPGVLVLKGLHARAFGGEVYGPVRFEFGPSPRYEAYLTASQVNLEEFGRQLVGSHAQLSGQAFARLHLTGLGPELSDMLGDGTIDIPKGRLYNLPLLLDLLKIPALHLPDGTAFEEAHARFAIRGNRVSAARIDLLGNSVSLRGQGEMNLDGSDVNLDFFGVWARIVQYLPPVIKDIPPYLSQHLLKIKVRGRVNEVHITTEPVPVLVEPLKEFLQWTAGRREPREGRPAMGPAE